LADTIEQACPDSDERFFCGIKRETGFRGDGIHGGVELVAEVQKAFGAFREGFDALVQSGDAVCSELGIGICRLKERVDFSPSICGLSFLRRPGTKRVG
jgi:hypothetical protein